MLSQAIRTIERVTTVAAALSGAMVVGLMASMVYEVAMRYLLNAPTMWAYEISYMLLGVGFTLAIGHALRERAHVRMDLLHDRWPPHVQALVDLIGFAVVLPLVAWLTWRLGGYAWEAYVTNERSGQSAWNPPIWGFRAALAVGFLTFTLQLAAEVLKAALAISGRPYPPASEDRR